MAGAAGVAAMAGRQTITVRDSSLLEAVIVALESGEYRQIVGSVTDGADGRCAIGVIHAVLERAGLPHPAMYAHGRLAP